MRFGVLVFAIGLAVAACGDSAAPATSAPSPTATVPATPAPAPAPPVTSATTATSSTTTTSTTTSTSSTTSIPPTPALFMEVTSLPELAGGYHYEGWAIIEGSAVSTGRFLVAGGRAITLDGEPVDRHEAVDIEAATAIILTIEPPDDPDPGPAAVHIVGGAVGDDGTAVLTIDHGAALGTAFTDASGTYVLATPSTDSHDDELSGIWFLTLPGPEPGLVLPPLPDSWIYEAWVVVDGVPLTTGKFVGPVGQDQSAPFSGPGRIPGFPGEDYITNAPAGVDLPTVLNGSPVLVSVEPVPDDSPDPFGITPLTGTIPLDAVEEPASYDLQQNLQFPVVVARIGV